MSSVLFFGMIDPVMSGRTSLVNLTLGTLN
nr:MAG TPA: Dynamin family [Caudoviricetes sp.]